MSSGRPCGRHHGTAETWPQAGGCYLAWCWSLPTMLLAGWSFHVSTGGGEVASIHCGAAWLLVCVPAAASHSVAVLASSIKTLAVLRCCFAKSPSQGQYRPRLALCWAPSAAPPSPPCEARGGQQDTGGGMPRTRDLTGPQLAAVLASGAPGCLHMDYRGYGCNASEERQRLQFFAFGFRRNRPCSC
jgi:hypothetical protein